MAPRLKAANLAKTTLASPCSSVSTTITVTSSAGFPSPPFRIFVGSETSAYEIMEVTAVNGTTWTVLRGRENTTARDWAAGTSVENRFTAGTYLELPSSFLDLTDTPSSYVGQGNKLVRVKSDASGLEFISQNSIPPAAHASTHQPGGSDALPTGTPAAITVGASASPGTSTSFARADHIHATPSTWPPSTHGNEAHNPAFADIETTSRTIYVDSINGSNTTGDGSSAAPYRTVSKALSTVKQLIGDGVSITIRLVGCGSANPYSIPTFGRLCIGSGNIVFEGELTTIYSGTATSGTATSITQSGANWTTNQFAGKLVKITIGATSYWRLIESNTSDTLNVIGRLQATPQSGNAFEIYDWNSYLASGQFYINAGTNVTLRYIAAQFSGNLIALRDYASLTLDRCYLKATGAGSYAIWGTSAKASSISVYYSLIDGNGYSNYGITTLTAVAFSILIQYSWIKGWSTSAVQLGGSGTNIIIRFGTILENGSTVVLIDRNSYANFYSDTVNGAPDKITIRNGSTYGLCVKGGSGVYACGTTYVNYSGNATDRYAESSSYSWYAD